MVKDRNGSLPEKDYVREEVEVDKKRKSKSRERADTTDSESDDPKHSKHRKKKQLEKDSDSKEDRNRRKSDKEKRKSRKRGSRSRDSDSESESDYSESESDSDSEEERRRRKRKRREREREEGERKRRRKEKEKKRRKKEKMERGKKGAVTNLWGKYGIIRETDMWNKRPEFTAWLAEVKQVNLESLPNWEEKQMFKQFMEDHNTATFPSKKYYNLDAYFNHKMEKEQTKGIKKILQSERTVFNDEEQRRLELLKEREKQKEEQVEALKRSMQSGMAQAMKEQAQLREEMAYQYKLGNFEAAAAIQRRLDPDIAM